MRDPDDTLAAIDDVIIWHGSGDAMVWTAEDKRPRLVLPTMPTVDPEAFAPLARQVQAYIDAITPAVRQMAEDMQHAMGAFAEFANSPAGRELIEAAERGELEGEPYQSCNCLCGPRHGDRMGICEGEAVGTRRYEAPSTGAVDVAMCGPCLATERTPAR